MPLGIDLTGRFWIQSLAFLSAYVNSDSKRKIHMDEKTNGMKSPFSEIN